MPAELRPESRPANEAAAWCLRLALAWFATRLLVLAWGIDPAIPPDESTHLGRILAYATTFGWPAASPENHALGLLSDRPFLYSWTLARLSALGLSDLFALRLVNAGMAFGTAVYALRFVRTLTPEPWAHVVFTVLFTNTLMLTGVGAAVSYDNGANLFATAGLYYASRFLREARPELLAATLLALGLGCVTKRSLLPLAAIVVVAIVALERGRIRDAIAGLARGARPLGLALAVVLLANALLYGANLARFGKLVPRFDQVVGLEAALENRIFARDHVLDAYRTGAVGFDEAIAGASRIAHPGDRKTAIAQLHATRKRLASGDAWRLGLAPYTLVWCRIQFERAFGYFGHRVLLRQPWERLAFGAVALLALLFQLASLRRAGGGRADIGPEWAFFGVAVAYALVLLFGVNRPSYVERGILDAGVQGRYLFPVWAPAMAFLAIGLWDRAPPRLRGVLAGAACALFVWSDLPSLLLRAEPGWFGS